jgi:hypothetical protein
MLAGMRSCFLLSSLLAFSVAACLPVQAQINGVPPSVTSIGFGGRFINGVRPSVTSLGPNGYGNDWPVFGNCCANFFMPANPNPPLFSEHHHHRKDRADFPVGVIEPAYIPYAVPYAPETDDGSVDDDSVDADYVHAPGQRTQDHATRRAGDRDSASKADASASPTPDESAPGEPAEPVAIQPSTVLVFKDGHQSDVLNYAIVGDTLFDFAAGRTRKILLADLDLPATRKVNDDRGVDFQIPASTTRQ